MTFISLATNRHPRHLQLPGAFFDGAGIHGTVDTWSIGTAASHGCIRMTIPDVEDLYPRVPLASPIYVG